MLDRAFHFGSQTDRQRPMRLWLPVLLGTERQSRAGRIPRELLPNTPTPPSLLPVLRKTPPRGVFKPMTSDILASTRPADIATPPCERTSPALLVPTSKTPGRAERIAIVFQDFASGGTERIMIRLANEWAKSRRVVILCGSAKGPARAAVSPAVEVIEMSPATPRSPLSRWKLGRWLAPAVREWRPDVIVGPGNHVLPIFLAAGTLPVPIVCKLSNPINPSGFHILPTAALAAARKRACAPVSRIVAMSPLLRDEAAAYLRTDRVTVIDEPICASWPTANRPIVHRSRRHPRDRILFAGRLVAQKNVSLALRTLAELPQDITLTIVGDGPDRKALEAQARRLGIAARVTFTGLVADITPFLTTSDIFLLRSRFEGYPAVLIEALAAGLPVVTTPCSPAMAEIVSHPSFGRVVAAEPIALAAAILALENSDGPNFGMLQPMLERHDLTTSANQWLGCLDETITKEDI